jgi:hypothetical protein
MTIEAELDATVASAVGPVVDEQLTGHTDRVSGVAIAPDGSWLASSRRPRSARRAERPGPRTGPQVRSGPGHPRFAV